MQLSILFAILQDMAAEGLAGRYMNVAALRFVKAYGRRHYWLTTVCRYVKKTLIFGLTQGFLKKALCNL